MYLCKCISHYIKLLIHSYCWDNHVSIGQCHNSIMRPPSKSVKQHVLHANVSCFNFACILTALAVSCHLSMQCMTQKGWSVETRLPSKPSIQEMLQIIKWLQLVQKAASPKVCLNGPWIYTSSLACTEYSSNLSIYMYVLVLGND